jgi:transposase
MKCSLFIGIDVSKATLDVSVISPSQNGSFQYCQFANSNKGFHLLLSWIRKNSEKTPIDCWKVCMENTGMYSLELNCFLQDKGIWQTLENALQIKRSMGMLRGKTDKADSRIIALYAYRFADKLKRYVLPGKALLRLRVLFAQRERLVDMHRQIQLAVQSLACFDKQLVADIQRQNKALLENLSVGIKKLDQSLKEALKQDEALEAKAKLIQSVPGVGLQTAVYLLITSRGMEGFETARQFACYSGCAPFEHRSGTSIRGRTKTHFLANRKMKTLLHMAAINAITFNDELKQFYQGKLEQGKHPMSVINAVRFKLICRIFSVVKRGSGYQKEYSQKAA